MAAQQEPETGGAECQSCGYRHDYLTLLGRLPPLGKNGLSLTPPHPLVKRQACVTWSLGLQSRPTRCDQATAESNPVTQKLISSTESELQQSYAKQRRTKSAALLHKELNCKSKRAIRDYLFRVNEATAILYARHVLASLLAEWPGHVPVSEDILELSGPAHMTYIFDMFMQLEEKHRWEKVIKQAKLGTHPSPLSSPHRRLQVFEQPSSSKCLPGVGSCVWL